MMSQHSVQIGHFLVHIDNEMFKMRLFYYMLRFKNSIFKIAKFQGETEEIFSVVSVKIVATKIGYVNKSL